MRIGQNVIVVAILHRETSVLLVRTAKVVATTTTTATTIKSRTQMNDGHNKVLLYELFI